MTENNTPLGQKLLRLPKFVDFELDIRPELDKAGINQGQFKQDCETDPEMLPADRLLVYARIFNCTTEELTSFTSHSSHH